MSEIVKSEYNALGEDNNYKTHFFKTSADQVVGLGRMKNTEYQIGDIVYPDTNNKVAMRCISNGTTSNEELDVSNALFGMDIYDGTCVWNIVGRISDSVPIGTIFAFGANEHPIGYLACDGTAVSRTVYADLFAVIGTTYGAGDGSTTFNLPNLNNNSFLEGSNTAGTVKSAGLPNITGAISINTYNYRGVYFNEGLGAFSELSNNTTITGMQTAGSNAPNPQALKATFNAKYSNSIYGNSDTVQPKSVTVKFCIKAYGAITNAGSVELEEMAKDYEDIAQRTSVVEQTLPKKANLGALSMPSGNYIDIAITSNSVPYVAPADGWIAFTVKNGTGDFLITNVLVNLIIGNAESGSERSIYVPIAKNANCNLIYWAYGTGEVSARFIYAQSEV